MSVVPRLSDLDLFLLTTPSDEEDSPWMVMADRQVREVDLLKPILIRYAQERQLPWYVASYLKIVLPRPLDQGTVEAAPDLLVAVAPERLRESWSVVAEGKGPELVIEVASKRSWSRDYGAKPIIYDGMGVQEYVLFAPERADGPPLLGWRRQPGGAFGEWSPDADGVLWSAALGGLGLVMVGGQWLRAVDAAGHWLPTDAEVVNAERRRAEAEAARADAERRRAETAETELARLREQVGRLRGEQR